MIMKCKCGCDRFRHIGNLKLKDFGFVYYKCVSCGNEILVDEEAILDYECVKSDVTIKSDKARNKRDRIGTSNVRLTV